MIVRIMAAIFVLTILVGAVPANADGPIKVGVAGDAWIQMTGTNGKLAKLSLLRGIYDAGYVLGAQLYMETTWETLIEAIDEFYEDWRNRKIWVLNACIFVAMEFRGESPEKIEAEVLDLRKIMSGVGD